ncbi:LytR/AlgR family response regulator transcription factor [Flavobacterium caeni]|uniref:Two component transcriptional regulator, LytTR family n=1 Tax=Flavobacterium caeni TaxID=490189 RepID=A0A1G5HHQ6_9FLAO|nr:LytTR family DNA-binding domain-containing protein [Flavobacterium caeni]SCY63392.1 two component transcriptional regulator, LytTR family [Flavobacterium caeni]
MKLKCLIVEDEPLARGVMEGFVAEVPFLEHVGSCADAFAAMQLLKDQPVDLMLLDIHLPKLKGLDFLAALQHPPMVIVASAYHEFALQSYEYNVVDYLLKPIAFGRFVVAVNKALDKKNSSVQPLDNPSAGQELQVNVHKRKARIAIDDILYIESQRENVKIVTTSRTVLTRYPISELEKELPASFLRIHRSFIVNKTKIDFYDAHDIEIAGKDLPIGRNYKTQVLETLAGKAGLGSVK